MFALPSEGANPIFGGVLGELEGSFSKDPSNQPRPLEQSRVQTAPCNRAVTLLFPKIVRRARGSFFFAKIRRRGENPPSPLQKMHQRGANSVFSPEKTLTGCKFASFHPQKRINGGPLMPRLFPFFAKIGRALPKKWLDFGQNKGTFLQIRKGKSELSIDITDRVCYNRGGCKPKQRAFCVAELRKFRRKG